jgi:hypothetical protein
MYNRLDASVFVSFPNGAFQPYCGRNNTMVFTGSTGYQYIDTVPINVTGNGFVQFDLNMGCGVANPNPFMVELQYSNRLGSDGTGPVSNQVRSGTAWQYVLPGQCNPAVGGAGCTTWAFVEPPGSWTGSAFSYGGTSWSGGSVFFSNDYIADFWGNPRWGRVTLPLPAGVPAGQRLRVIAQRYNSATQWAISNLYVGSSDFGCVDACGGRGSCRSGLCVCDPGSTLARGTCVPVGGILELKETFESALLPIRWSFIGGGTLSTVVTVTSGRNLYFSGLSTRRLVTVNMDTTFATFIQCSLSFGPFISTTSDVVLSYSTDGGRTWVFLGSYITTGTYGIPLPPGAMQVGVRFQWWQPTYATSSN